MIVIQKFDFTLFLFCLCCFLSLESRKWFGGNSILEHLLLIYHLDGGSGATWGIANGSGIGSVLFRVGTSVCRDTAILSEGNVETAVIPPAGEENDGKAEANNEQQVEDTEEDEG